MPTYGDRKFEFIRGRGCYLYNKKNEKYLDFASGIAQLLGHCHPNLLALNSQSKQLWHVSNLTPKKQEEFAKLLCTNSFANKVFTNSELSYECGIKI